MIRRLAADQRGVATLEFALWACCIFLVLLAGLDFGIWRVYQLRLDAAVEQGALMAFNGRDTLDQPAAGTIAGYVRAAARLPGEPVTVSASCNGSACERPDASRSCACLSTTNGANHYAPAACGSPCADGATAGYYLTLDASYPYRPAVLPQGVLAGQAITRSATIRLQ